MDNPRDECPISDLPGTGGSPMQHALLIAEGNSAHVYLDDKKIYKRFKLPFSLDTAEHEAKKQQLAYASGLPVPVVYELSEAEGYAALVMEYVPGLSLGQLVLSEPDRLSEYIDRSIQLQLAIHQIVPIEIESMVERLRSQIRKAPRLNEDEKRRLVTRMESFQFVSRLCHGDFHLHNLIQTETGVMIIDWMDASLGDAQADVCRTYLLYLENYPELAESYVSHYCEKTGTPRDEVLKWLPILAAARLSESVGPNYSDYLCALSTST